MHEYPARLRAVDRGTVMPMTTILIVFLMLSSWALVSASQQWNARRTAYAVAAAAARAGAQGDQIALRSNRVVDPGLAVQRARSVLATSNVDGTVRIDDATVTVTVRLPVDYAFPTPGFPPTVSGTASATATPGVTSANAGP